jgi:hypothetical protein
MFAHVERRLACAHRRLDFNIVLQPCAGPSVGCEIAFVNEQICERTVMVRVRDVGCLSSVPGMQVGVLGVTRYITADGTLPVCSREAR